MSAAQLARILVEEGFKARAHYQIWDALRYEETPEYRDAMDEFNCFFGAAIPGHFTLFFLSLGKIFDSNHKNASIRVLKEALKKEGKTDASAEMERLLKAHTMIVCKVRNIRNQCIAHNDRDISADDLFKLNDVTREQIRDLIEAACSAINVAVRALEINGEIFDSNVVESTTLKMLEVLTIGTHAKREQFDS